MIASQTEFPISVPVCAWCKPKEQRQVVGLLSHGICPRHLRLMKLEAQGFSRKRRALVALPHSEREDLLLPLI